MSDNRTTRTNKASLWAGRILSGLIAALLLFSGTMKLLGGDEVVKGFTELGYDSNLRVTIGIIEIACVVFYVIPQTAVLGAILLTGYLGGATATHVRVGDGNWFGPIIIGVLVWLGIFLRDTRLRELMPVRSQQ